MPRGERKKAEIKKNESVKKYAAKPDKKESKRFLSEAGKSENLIKRRREKCKTRFFPFVLCEDMKNEAC